MLLQGQSSRLLGEPNVLTLLQFGEPDFKNWTQQAFSVRNPNARPNTLHGPVSAIEHFDLDDGCPVIQWLIRIGLTGIEQHHGPSIVRDCYERETLAISRSLEEQRCDQRPDGLERHSDSDRADAICMNELR